MRKYCFCCRPCTYRSRPPAEPDSDVPRRKMSARLVPCSAKRNGMDRAGPASSTLVSRRRAAVGMMPADKGGVESGGARPFKDIGLVAPAYAVFRIRQIDAQRGGVHQIGAGKKFSGNERRYRERGPAGGLFRGRSGKGFGAQPIEFRQIHFRAAQIESEALIELVEHHPEDAMAR